MQEELTEQNKVAIDIDALAKLRDCFDLPVPGSALDGLWLEAMGMPECVPAYVLACVAAQAAEIAALKAKLEVDPAHSYDGIDCRDETIKMQDAAMGTMLGEIAALKADYLRACQTVAAMHEAATGRSGEAPWLGVVEDVAEAIRDPLGNGVWQERK